jgi:hypothetical protein
MAILLFKLILCPLLIGAVSLAGRRWGPSVSGWLVGLPLTSAPVVLFLAIDQGRAFAAASAQAIMVGLISVGIFCLTYSWLARRLDWLPTLLLGWLTVFASIVVLDQISTPLLPAFVGVLVAMGMILKLFPKTYGLQPAEVGPRWDIPARMIIVTVFVLALTGLAQLLGPRLSGLLAPFPLYATILAVFTHRFHSAQASSNLLRGVVLGSFSPVIFFLAVAALIQPVGIPLTFLCATSLTLAVHGLSLMLLRRSHHVQPEVRSQTSESISDI